MKKIILYVGIHLLWFAAVFDPIGNLYQLRYIALGYALTCALFSISVQTLLDEDKRLRNLLIVCISAFMPIYGLLLYSLRAGDAVFVDTSYLAAGVLLLTTLIYRNKDLCETGVQAMVFSLRLLTIVIIGVYVSLFLGINSDWVSFFTEGNAALVSSREYGGVTLPYILFLASPMIIYLIGYDIHRLVMDRSIFRLLICTQTLFAFALTGTRAHIIIALAYIPIYYLIMHSRNKVLTLIVTGVLGASLVVLINPHLISEFFSAKEASNELKIQLLDMYADSYSNPLTLLFGQGYNAHEWYLPLREKLEGIENASKTELTYLELIRVYGLIVSMFFFCLIAALTYRVAHINKEYKWFYPAFLIFMVNSAVNPYLFSTNGILPLALLVAIVSLRKSGFKNRIRFLKYHEELRLNLEP